MQIKTTLRYHYTPIRMAKIWTITTPNADEDVEQELPFTADENAKWYSHFGRQFGNFLENYIRLPWDPAITLLAIYPKELNT